MPYGDTDSEVHVCDLWTFADTPVMSQNKEYAIITYALTSQEPYNSVIMTFQIEK